MQRKNSRERNTPHLYHLIRITYLVAYYPNYCHTCAKTNSYIVWLCVSSHHTHNSKYVQYTHSYTQQRAHKYMLVLLLSLSRMGMKWMPRFVCTSISPKTTTKPEKRENVRKKRKQWSQTGVTKLPNIRMRENDWMSAVREHYITGSPIAYYMCVTFGVSFNGVRVGDALYIGINWKYIFTVNNDRRVGEMLAVALSVSMRTKS